MSILTPAEIASLREDHPHSLKTYMSILVPDILYVGQVTGAPVNGARTITVADISGDISDVVAGQTVEVYDPATGKIISRRRVRSVTDHDVLVDENSVPWSNSYYMRFLHTWELWSIYPYIDPATKIFYKDYDISYTDQNDQIPPVAIAGSARAGFLTLGSITFALDASDSYAIADGAVISTYAWECDGGVIDNPAAAVTTITFTIAGQYWLKLTVTDDNGKAQSTYRPIFVHERSGSNAPITSFEIMSMSGTWDTGGWRASVKMMDDATLTDLPDNAMIVIWSENWYNGVETCIGSNGNIRLVGYVKSESISKTLATGEVEFELMTINSLLDRFHMYSISLEEIGSTPATWYQMNSDELTIARAAHHLWKWHSTLFEIADVFLPITDTRSMPACDDMEEGSLYSMLNWIYENGIFAKVVSNRTGRLYIEQDIQTLGDAQRAAIDDMMTIADIDRRGDDDVQIVRKSYKDIPQVIGSGIGKDSDGHYVAIMAQSPMTIPENIGSQIYNVERLVIADQDDLNTLTGRLYSISTNEIDELRIAMAGMYPVDIVPQYWWDIDIEDSYTKRGIEIDGNIVCREVNEDYNMQGGYVLVDGVFSPDPDTKLGYTYYMPEDPTPIAPSQPPDYGDLPVYPPSSFPSFNTPPYATPDCQDDPAAPENGPYPFGGGGTIYSDPDLGNQHQTYEAGTYRSRGALATYKTKAIIAGYFEYSDDGLLWHTMEDNTQISVDLMFGSSVRASAVLTGGGASPLEATFSTATIFNGIRIKLATIYGGGVYKKGSLITSGSALATDDDGNLVSDSLIVNNYYAIQAVDGPWYKNVPTPGVAMYDFNVYQYVVGGGWSGAFGWDGDAGTFKLDYAGMGPSYRDSKALDAYRAIVYFQAKTTNLRFRVAGYIGWWYTQSSALGYQLYNAYPPARIYRMRLQSCTLYNLCAY